MSAEIEKINDLRHPLVRLAFGGFLYVFFFF